MNEGLRYSIAFYDFETKERCDVVQANTLTIANACKKLVETETGGVFGKPIIIDNKKRRVCVCD